MKLPNKLFTYQESIISKFPLILNEIADKEYITIYQLCKSVLGKFNDISEILETLECLYALGKINYDYELGRIKYAA